MEEIIAFLLPVRYNFVWDFVAVAVEDCNIVVRLEGVGCDYHYSTVEMVQVVDRRVEGAGGMRMRDAHHAKIHWEHEIRKTGEPTTMRSQRGNQDVADQDLVFFGISA